HIFFTNNNRLIINTYYNVYNMPIPMSLTITSHLIGAEINAIEYPSETNEPENISIPSSSPFSLHFITPENEANPTNRNKIYETTEFSPHKNSDENQCLNDPLEMSQETRIQTQLNNL